MWRKGCVAFLGEVAVQPPYRTVAQISRCQALLLTVSSLPLLLPQSELLGGVGTPTSQDHTSAATAFGAGIWSTGTTAAPSPPGSLAGAPGYDAHLLSMLRGPEASSSAAAAPAAGFGGLGGFGGLPASTSAFDQRPLTSSSGSLLPFPGGGLQAAGQLGGWRSGEGMQVQQQPAFSGLPAAASLWGGSGGGLGAGLPGSGEQLVR